MKQISAQLRAVMLVSLVLGLNHHQDIQMDLGAKLIFVVLASILVIIIASVVWFETHIPEGYYRPAADHALHHHTGAINDRRRA